MAETIYVELVEDQQFPAIRAICVDNLRIASGKATGSWRAVKQWPVSLNAFLRDVAEIARYHGIRVTFTEEDNAGPAEEVRRG